MSFNATRENKILTKISEFTAFANSGNSDGTSHLTWMFTIVDGVSVKNWSLRGKNGNKI